MPRAWDRLLSERDRQVFAAKGATGSAMNEKYADVQPVATIADCVRGLTSA